MKCPGQDSRFWKPGAIYEVECPECGKQVEFFKDDTSRKCPSCGHRFVNPKMDFGCAAYCPFAEQCLGTLPPEAVAQREELFKDRVAVEMKKYFGRDFKKIGRATRRARYAEQIGKAENANPAIVLSAAYLQELDENTNGSEPQNAVNILENLKASPEMTEGIRKLLKKNEIGKEDSIDARVTNDARLMVDLEDRLKNTDISESEVNERIEKAFLTETGRKAARSNLFQK